ncbi:hypothetical protein BDV12DRAFT_174184 [Aspergillus spectabilis]
MQLSLQFRSHPSKLSHISKAQFHPLSPLYKPLKSFIMGVEVQRISPGDGQNFPKRGDTVTIHYVGTLADGSKFDSSRDRNDPFVTAIGIGRVIKGWDEGVPQLSIGEKANLICTPDYAYGPRGFPPVIPPNATLKFEVELIKIN